MQSPSFAEFADFVRRWAGLSPDETITPETKFEDDLGITGDDGDELLEAAERHFRIRLSDSESGYRRTFGLAPDEFLFHSEGFFASEFIRLFQPVYSVREFTVGELYDAVQRATTTKIRG